MQEKPYEWDILFSWIRNVFHIEYEDQTILEQGVHHDLASSYTLTGPAFIYVVSKAVAAYD